MDVGEASPRPPRLSDVRHGPAGLGRDRLGNSVSLTGLGGFLMRGLRFEPEILAYRNRFVSADGFPGFWAALS